MNPCPAKMKKTPIRQNITIEEAEESANEWVGRGESPMRSWLIQAIMDPKQHRDIGKVLAYVAEFHVNEWISKRTGRPIKSVIGESYDGITDDDKPPVRNQIKFRMNEWHLETTRRHSKKNAETNQSGHVAYRLNEFDVLTLFIPSPTFGISGSKIRCIPASALVHPKKPNQLKTTIDKSTRITYDCDNKTDEVINMLYHFQTLSLPPD